MARTIHALVLFAVIFLILAAGCTGRQATTATTIVTPTVTIAVPDSEAAQKTFQSLPQSALNESETADIVYLQEAEKLESDLNSALFLQHHDITIFANISAATKVAMNADNVILQRYGIPNPENAAPGVFANAKLQDMYNKGVNAGLSGGPEALEASALEEDLHISDLSAALTRTDNADVSYIYRNELVLSKNNLRGLSQWLTAYGRTYTPVYISQDYYNQIVSTPMESLPLQ